MSTITANRSNVVKIMGGLGNQLFGYVFSKHLERCGEVGLDIDFYNSPANHTDEIPEREFLLDKFTTDYKLATPGRRSTVTEEIYDKTKGYGNGYFWGYWQKGSYYKGLKLDLRLKDEYITDEMRQAAEVLKSGETVSVHFRRTDYGQFDNWILDQSYYERAIKEMHLRLNDPVFFVFTDDIDWIKSQTNGKSINVIHGSELEDFYLMSQCKHNIIANSSFSFWAAMLNNNLDKVVIYPKDWKVTENPVDFEGWTGV